MFLYRKVCKTLEVFEVFGFTAGCPGCMSLPKGTARHARRKLWRHCEGGSSTPARDGISGQSSRKGNETNEVDPGGRTDGCWQKEKRPHCLGQERNGQSKPRQTDRGKKNTACRTRLRRSLTAGGTTTCQSVRAVQRTGMPRFDCMPDATRTSEIAFVIHEQQDGNEMEHTDAN